MIAIKINRRKHLMNRKRSIAFVLCLLMLFIAAFANMTTVLAEATDATPENFTFTGDWSEQDGVYSADAQDAFFECKFTGTSVEYYAVTGPEMGKVKVYVDGIFAKEIDLYAEQGEKELVFSTKLDEGIHILGVGKSFLVNSKAAGDKHPINVAQVKFDSSAGDFTEMTLNGAWKIVKDPGGESDYSAKIKYPAQSDLILVPGNIYETYPSYNGYTWYAKEFTAKKAGEGMKQFIRFDAVQCLADVYLNGEKLGSNDNSDVPFEFDVTDVLKDGENFLAVKVYNPAGMCKVASYSEYPAFWDAGGIWQDVNLLTRGGVFIEDVYAKTDWLTGKVALEITVNNTTGAQAQTDLFAVYGEFKGAKLGATDKLTKDLPKGKSVVELDYTIDNFKLWDTENPNLYYADVTAVTGGNTQTYSVERMGFRHIEMKDGYFYLNGKRFMLKTTHQNCYDPITFQGSPRDLTYQFKGIDQLKAAGFNCFRSIAMSIMPEVLDYCDEVGMLAYEESSQSWLGMNHWDSEMYTKMVIRDRNHPSVAIWGFLNEVNASDARTNKARKYLTELREYDETRLVCFSSGRWDRDYSYGSFSNSGSTTWDVMLGGEGEKADSPGDVHFYPNYPFSEDEAYESIYKLGKDGDQPTFISETGTGNTPNVFLDAYKRTINGADPNSYMTTGLSNNVVNGITSIYNKYGLNKIYDTPEDVTKDSESNNILQRYALMNYIRANGRLNGVGATSLSDAQSLGEGLMDNFRDWKTGIKEVFSDMFAPLCWAYLLDNTSFAAEKGSIQRFRANIATEDVLPAGDYSADFVIKDADGKTVYEKKNVAFEVESGSKAPLAYEVFDESIKLDFAAGRYTFEAKLNSDGYKPTNTSYEFEIIDNTGAAKEKEVTLAGDFPKDVTELFKEQGMTVSEFNASEKKDGEVILIGSNAPQTDAFWKAVYEKMASGAYVAILDKDSLGAGLNRIPSTNKGSWRKYTGFSEQSALYHAEHIAMGDTLFAGLKQGALSPAMFGTELLASFNKSGDVNGYFVDMDMPEETNVLVMMAQGLPLMGGASNGIGMGTYKYFNGYYTINALDLLTDNMNVNCKRLLLNLVNYGHEHASAVTAVDEEQLKKSLSDLGIKDSTVTTIAASDESVSYSNGSIAYDYDGAKLINPENIVTMSFTGSMLKIFGNKNSECGKAAVYVDNNFVGDIDTYAASYMPDVEIFRISGLANAEHSLRIEVKGDMNEASTGTGMVPIRRFEITADPEEDTDKETVYYVSEATFTNPGVAYDFDGGKYVNPDNEVTLKFKGMSLRIMGDKNVELGRAEVYVDGVKHGDMDAYSASLELDTELYRIDGLEQGTHTLKLMIKGDKNPASTGVGMVPLRRFIASNSQSQGYETSRSIAANSEFVTYSNPGIAYDYDGAKLTNPDNEVTFSFDGYSLKIFGNKNSELGKAAVYVDGELIGYADAYAPSYEPNVELFGTDKLTDSTHNVKLVINGDKNDASTGTMVPLIRFETISAGGGFVVVNDHDNDITYWGNYSNGYGHSTELVNGDEMYLNAGSELSYTFKGERVQLIFTANSELGKGKVYLDDKFVGYADTYSPSIKRAFVGFDSGIIGYGEHKITLKVEGEKNDASTGTMLAFDAIKYIGEETQDNWITVNDHAAQIKYIKGSSTGYGGTRCIGGDETYLNSAEATFTFNGSRAQIIVSTNREMGKAKIYLDGEFIGYMDTYSGTLISKVIAFDTGIVKQGKHTLRIVTGDSLGFKNPKSTGYMVALDAIRYIPYANLPEDSMMSISGVNEIYLGQIAKLTAKVSDEGYEGKIVWSSSDENVLTVGSFGMIKAIGVGHAVITAKTADGKLAATHEIDVRAKEIKGIDGADVATIGKPEQYTAVTYPESLNNDVAWEVIDFTGKATIDQNGLLTPISAGKVIIKVTSTQNRDLTALRLITINEPEKINVNTLNVKLAATLYTYDGKVKKPAVTVTDADGKKIASSNYTVSYASGRKLPGTYTVKVTMKGNYTGTKTLTFAIRGKQMSVSKLTALSKGFKATWAKQSYVTGYQVQYSTSSKFTAKTTKTATIAKYTTTSKTVTKLKASAKYYVRVRSYKTTKIGAKSYNVYSAWSKAKTVTTKK